MANKEYSKEKLLLLYDIFKNEVGANEPDLEINLEFLKDKLKSFMIDLVGDEDEKLIETDRKTMYKYIDAINNYIEWRGEYHEDGKFIDEDSDDLKYGQWIKCYRKKIYVRGPLDKELTSNEYEAISDAISSSPIVDTKAFEHFSNMCPKSLTKNKTNAVYFRHNSVDSAFSKNVAAIKEAIYNKKSISFQYGYRIGPSGSKKNKLFAVSDKTVTPLKLDYSDGKFYLYALDNNGSQFRSYRLDRIEKVTIDDKIPYIEIEGVDKKLSEKIEGAVNQFATGKDKTFKLIINCNNPKVAAQAFQSFADAVTVKTMINDSSKWEKGDIECLCDAQLSPTFYMRLFNLVTFDIAFDASDSIDLNVTIDPDVQNGQEVLEGFSQYCDKLNEFLKKV
ncbi:MAG: WYL domain-containing protein [Clostridia bacterium]|nr:WYL domain-containing protein [Clostridia bacterium]